METGKTPEQVEAHMAGQITALGIAVHLLLTNHPQRNQLEQAIHHSIEDLVVKGLASPMRDEVLRGIQAVRDIYLVRPQADPGQPRR